MVPLPSRLVQNTTKGVGQRCGCDCCFTTSGDLCSSGNLYLEDVGIPGVDGGGAMRGPILVGVVQPGLLPCHLPQGASAPTVSSEPGWGSAVQLSAAAQSLPSACCEQPGLCVTGRGLPRAQTSCGRELGGCQQLH